MKDNEQFASLLSGISCVMTIAKSPFTAVSSKLMDLMTIQKVDKKFLLIITPSLDTGLLQNKTTNLNVIFAHPGSGMSKEQGDSAGLHTL